MHHCGLGSLILDELQQAIPLASVYFLLVECLVLHFLSPSLPLPHSLSFLKEPVENISAKGDLLYWERPPGRISFFKVKCYDENDNILFEKKTTETQYLLTSHELQCLSIKVQCIIMCISTVHLMRSHTHRFAQFYMELKANAVTHINYPKKVTKQCKLL